MKKKLLCVTYVLSPISPYPLEPEPRAGATVKQEPAGMERRDPRPHDCSEHLLLALVFSRIYIPVLSLF